MRRAFLIIFLSLIIFGVGSAQIKIKGHRGSTSGTYTGTEVDGVIGNEVKSATNTTLTRSGYGTAGSPYTLGLNLSNTNTWLGKQTFNSGVAGTSGIAFTQVNSSVPPLGSNGKVLSVDADGNVVLRTDSLTSVGDGNNYTTGISFAGTTTKTLTLSRYGLANLSASFTINADDVGAGTTNLFYTNSLARAAISSAATGLTYTGATGVFSLTSGYVIPTTIQETNWGAAYSHISNTSNPHSVTSTQVLPSQTGNTGKVLTTNGTSASWGTPACGSLDDNYVTVAKLDTGATGFIDVRKFGAVGDGSTNDTQAIINAITYASTIWASVSNPATNSSGNTVYFHPGIYVVDTTINIPTHVILKGTPDASVIRASADWDETFQHPVISFGPAENHYALLDGIDIDCAGMDSTIAVYAENIQEYSGWMNSEVLNNDGAGSIGLWIKQAQNCYFSGIGVHGKRYAIYVESTAGKVAIQHFSAYTNNANSIVVKIGDYGYDVKLSYGHVEASNQTGTIGYYIGAPFTSLFLCDAANVTTAIQVPGGIWNYSLVDFKSLGNVTTLLDENNLGSNYDISGENKYVPDLSVSRTSFSYNGIQYNIKSGYGDYPSNLRAKNLYVSDAVGIGTTNSANKLNVGGGTKTDSLTVGSGGVYIRALNYVTGDSSLAFVFYNAAISRLDTVFAFQSQVSGGGTGDITAVTAGEGLKGGGSSGAVTVDLNISAAGGLQVVSDSTKLKLADASLSTSSSGLKANIGTTSGTVAAGNHNHSGTYEPANANIQSHISSTANPHSVTSTQVLPSQTGNTGKFLTTNGTSASWGTALTTETGDIAGVTASSPLTGGGTSGTVTVGADTNKLATHHWVQSQGYGVGGGDIETVTAGAGLVGGGIAGSVTLDLSISANGGLQIVNSDSLSTKIDGTTLTKSSAGLKANLGTTSGTVASGDHTHTGYVSTTLLSGNIVVGNVSNVATSVAMSGDATITNTGAVTVGDDSHAHSTTTVSGLDISNDTNLSAGSGIVLTGDALSHSTADGYKHIPATGSSTQMLQYSSTGTAKWITMSGDASIADNGAITVGDDSHAHTGTTISGIDISSDTNLGAGNGLVLSGDNIVVSVEADGGLIAGADSLGIKLAGSSGLSISSAGLTIEAISSSAWAAKISDETGYAGTGKIMFSEQPVIVDWIDIEAAGVRLFSDDDGSIGFTGIGDGISDNDESILFNLMDVSNEVGVSSSSGVTKLNLGSIGIGTTSLAVTGNSVSFANGTITTGDAKHFRFSVLAPNSMFTTDSCICIVPKLDRGITIDSLTVTTSSASYNIAGDLRYANAFIGRVGGSIGLIKAVDTSSGVLYSGTFDDSTVDAGKCIYLKLDSAPSASMTQFSVDIKYRY